MAAVKAVDEVEEVVKLLLLFVVLCASRVGEAVGALRSEIDLDNAVWVVPPERMKGNAEHRVPLSTQALELLDRARVLGSGGPLVFPSGSGRRAARPLRSADLLRLVRHLDLKDPKGRPVVTHGFRATFRTWAMEVAQAPFEVCEAALAHVQTNETVSAYARSNLLEPRRELMQRWADYVLPGASR